MEHPPSPPSFPGINLFSDGSFLRTAPPPYPFPLVPPDPSFVDGVASKDIVAISDNGVWVRIYLPEFALNSSKLPIVVYFHGGGFVLCSAAEPLYHEFCKKLAKGGRVIVVSVEYRLAPEHRLPAAFDDCFDGLKWLQKQAVMGIVDTVEPWLSLYADYSVCFLMGHSAGAAIVHQVALRAVQEEMSPLKLCGLILVVPFFGGSARVPSEMKFRGEGMFLTLQMTDYLWSFSLPKGASRDHEFCNVTRSDHPQLRGKNVPPVLVVVAERDLLRDWQIEYVKGLESGGIRVKLVELKDAEHATLWNKEVADTEFEHMLRFMEECKAE